MATSALPTISYEDISGFWALPNDILQHRGVDHHLVSGAVVVGAVVVVVDRRLQGVPVGGALHDVVEERDGLALPV